MSQSLHNGCGKGLGLEVGAEEGYHIKFSQLGLPYSSYDLSCDGADLVNGDRVKVD